MLKALNTLSGLDQMTDGARAALIIKTAQRIEATERASAPKDALKQQVKMPGSAGGNTNAGTGSLRERLYSKDPNVAKKAAIEATLQQMQTKDPKKDWKLE